MASGLQVFDGQGRVVLDTSSYSGRLLGTTYIGAGPGSGTIWHDGFYSGTPFCIPFIDQAQGLGAFDFNMFWSVPQVSFSGNALNWSRPQPMGFGAQYPHCQLWYGVR